MSDDPDARREPAPKSPSPVEESLSRLAASIEPEVRSVEGVEEWIETHGLGRTDSPAAVVARQAALHVSLVAALYESYRREGVGLGPLDGGTFRERVEDAAERTGDGAFEPYVLSEVADLFGAEDRSALIDAGERFVGTDAPAEAIGSLHESLVPRTDRHRLGQFRTPPAIAALMAEWAVGDADDTVLDPGIGAGALSAAAWGANREREGDPEPAAVVGVDVSELSALMATTALGLSDGGGRPDVRRRNFLEMDPAETGTVDAVVANPPYTRHHELDEGAKADLNGRMESEAGRSLSGLSPLYAYFYVHAAEFIADDGRATFVTPSEFLETTYGEDLKAFLLERFRVRGLVLYDRDVSQFDEAMTTSLISFLEAKGGEEEDGLTTFVRVEEWPGREAVLNAVSDGIDGDTEWGFVNTVRQSDLDPAKKWDEFFDPLEIGSDDRLVPLSALGEVNRGIATGENDYFCLCEDDLAGSAAGYKWEIDDRYLSKLVRNSRSVPHFDYREDDWKRQRAEGEEVWLLYHLDGQRRPGSFRGQSDGERTARLDEFADGGGGDGGENDDRGGNEAEGGDSERQPGVAEYLAYGRDELAVHDGYLARNREPWYVVDRRDPAPIVYTYMSRSRGRFVRNRTDARTLTNLHCVYLDADLDDVEIDALLAYLNSPPADEIVKRHGRTYSTGMDKIEPNELEGVPVLDPRTLDPDAVSRLAGLFEELCAASRDGDEEGVLAEIGDAIDGILEW